MTRPLDPDVTRPRRLALPALALMVLGALVPAAADAYPPDARTVLVSRTADGTAANGASRNPVISQDKRFGRVVAFESDASNLAAGASPGVSNIYATYRADPFPDNGTAWSFGHTVLLSKGRDGQPANGPSSQPAIDGSSRTAPRCVAFVSAASNLVAGDTNGQPDAFVARLDTGTITRVSVSSSGRQSNGATTQVAIDGRCTRVAFVSTATNLALTQTSRPSWKSARTTRGRAGTRQVFLRAIGGTSLLDRALKGLTFVASASNGHLAGNGDSFDPVLSARGLSLAFTSVATNLGGAPRAGTSQIYQRAMKRRFGRKIHGRTVQDLEMSLHLVSGAHGQAGNDSSSAPANDAAGDVFAYQTLATNLLPGVTHGVSQIIKTTIDAGGRHHEWVSRHGVLLGDGASRNASMTDGAEWVFFDTSASNLRSDGAGSPAVQITFAPYRWTVSSDSNDVALRTDSTHPDSSPHGNYIVFENAGLVVLRWLGPK